MTVAGKTTFPDLSIWTLIRLQDELDDIALQLEQMDLTLDQGNVDPCAFEAVIHQIRQSSDHLKMALVAQPGSRRPS